MKKFISFSGGVESTAMCVLYGGDAEAIWCDTGSEHSLMYDRIEFCEAEILKIHPNFILHRIQPAVMCKGEVVHSLQDFIVKSKFMPSATRRYCTGKFKIEPIDSFLAQQGACELLIGFNADETARTGSLEKAKNVVYRYPLMDDDYNREDCEFILKNKGLHPNFPPYMKRGGCKFCIFKSIKEYKAMYFFNRAEFNQCLKLEQELQDQRKAFYAISMSGQSLQSIAATAEREILMFGLQGMRDMYSNIQPSQACGAFCHR
jgi:hypothetical protein